MNEKYVVVVNYLVIVSSWSAFELFVDSVEPLVF